MQGASAPVIPPGSCLFDLSDALPIADAPYGAFEEFHHIAGECASLVGQDCVHHAKLLQWESGVTVGMLHMA